MPTSEETTTETTPEGAAEVTPEEETPTPPAAETPAAEPEASPAPEVPQPELVGAHRQSGAESFSFRLDGAEVNDFARVQAHIVELETFRTETIQGSRTAFVDGLVEARVVTAPQAEQFRALVGSMSNDQFDQFKAGFEGMAPSNLFARHDLGETGGSSQEIDAVADRISILEGIVMNHRHRGASDEEIQKLSSYKELQTLKNATA